MKRTLILLASLLSISCSSDDSGSAKTMTTNSLSNLQWNQKLHHTVAIGIDVDSAFGILRHNGFICFGAASDPLVGCQKLDGIPGLGERRQWNAQFRTKNGKIASIRGFYQVM